MKFCWVFIVVILIIALLMLLLPIKITIATIPTLAPQKVQLSKNDIKLIIIEAAIRHDIEIQKFLKTAKCESSLRPKAVGDGGKSKGIFQIHLPSHPDVSEEEAFDPHFSSEWSAKKFKENPHIWTCYTKLYGKKNQTTNLANGRSDSAKAPKAPKDIGR